MDARQLTLAGRIMLVTGASSGIGEGIALALAAAGATVIVAARRANRIATLAQRIAEYGGTAVAVELNVLDEASIARGIEHIGSTYGRLDALVNNAGVLGRGAAGDADIGEWRTSVETNLLGAMLVTHAALPLLKASEGADIVNISSTAARSPNAGSAPYGAAKAGLNAFTESLRKEVAPQGMRVTLVQPGLVATEFYDHVADDIRRPWMKELEPLQPSDVGDAIAFVLAQPRRVNINELMIRPTGQLG
jgi:clavulanate-9-aldehyde reductase